MKEEVQSLAINIKQNQNFKGFQQKFGKLNGFIKVIVDCRYLWSVCDEPTMSKLVTRLKMCFQPVFGIINEKEESDLLINGVQR